MKVVLSAGAEVDYEEISDYLLLEYRPQAAKEQGDRILAAIESLAAFPLSGRVGRVPGTFEKVCVGTPFLVV